MPPPKYYFNTHKDTLNALSWPDLKKDFSSQFGPNKNPASGSLRYHSRQQSKDEPLTHYLYEKKFLADSYDPTMKFNDFLTSAISGMQSKYIYHFAQQPITTFTQLIEMAATHERAESMVQQREEARVPLSPVTTPITPDSVHDITNRLDQLQLLLHTHMNAATNSPVALATSQSQPVSRSPSPKQCTHCKTPPYFPSNCPHHNNFSPQQSRSVSPACTCAVHPKPYNKSRNSFRDRSPSPYPRHNVKFSDQQRSQSNPGTFNRQSRQRNRNNNRYSNHTSPSSDRSSYRSTSSSSASSNRPFLNRFQPNFNGPYGPMAMYAPPYPYYPHIPPFPFHPSNQTGPKN